MSLSIFELRSLEFYVSTLIIFFFFTVKEKQKGEEE